MFTLLAVLVPDAPDVPLDAIIEKVQALFGGDAGPRWEYERHFRSSRAETSSCAGLDGACACSPKRTPRREKTRSSSRASLATTPRPAWPKAPAACVRCSRTIQKSSTSTDGGDHVMLEEIEGAIVFDPQKNDLMK